MPSTLSPLSLVAAIALLSTSVVASLGHHAHPGLTSLSHLPPVVGVPTEDGGIVVSEQDSIARRELDARYYGDSRGFSRPAPLGPEKRAIPAGWSEVGCVNEGTTARALTGFSYRDNKMTVDMCMATCLAKGFVYAGLEWGDECYCGNTFGSGGGGPSNESCNVACLGSSSQSCGGWYSLSAYRYTGTTCAGSAAASGTGLTPSATGSVSNPTASVTGSLRASTFSASASASASATKSASASAASASASASAGTTTTEWENIGCFLDNPNLTSNKHILQGTSLLEQKNMTPGLCQTRCAGQGYNFAGLEYGQECWCGDLTSSEVSALKSNSPYCNMACTGDSSKTCGGGWSMDIYEQVDVSDSC